MGVYYETIKKFPHIQLKQPPSLASIANKEGFFESEATKLTFGLAGIVMAGVFKAHANHNYAHDFADTANIVQYTSDGERNTNIGKKLLPPKIDGFKKIIPYFIPKEEKEKSKIKSDELSLLGLTSLGILALVYPDLIGEATIRFQALTYIFRDDPLAALLHSSYPEVFNGYKVADDLLKLKDKINIPESELRKIYFTVNSDNEM